MVYDVNNINLNIIKQYKSNLLSEKNGFINKTYNTFLSSHLNTSSDAYVKLIVSKLDVLYKDINDSYDSILKWFNDYIENASSLESFLSGNFGLANINESVLRNYVDSKLNVDIENKI